MALKCEACKDMLDSNDSLVYLKTKDGLKRLWLCKACQATMQNLCHKSGDISEEAAEEGDT